MNKELLNIIYVLTIFLLVFYSVFLLGVRGEKRYNNRILSLFLFINSIPILFRILIYLKVFFSIKYSSVLIFMLGADLLQGPLIYFYFRSLIDKNFRVIKDGKNHLITVLMFFLYLFFRQIFTLIFPDLISLKSLKWEIVIVLFLIRIVLLFYFFQTFKNLLNYKKKIKEEFSSLKSVDLVWFQTVIIFYGVIWIFHMISAIALFFKKSVQIQDSIAILLNLIIATFFIFKGLKSSFLFSDLKPKYSKYSLSKKEKENYLKTLSQYMKINKPYLNPILTLTELSEGSGIQVRYLSQIINDNLNRNFFDFINNYRTETAQKMLIDKNNKMSVLEISLESGFNSKSVFNRVFKKNTGYSPSNYKKK